MPMETVIVVAGVAAAFTVFALVLAWAERVTRKR
jgi:hypothetical protein